MKKMTNNEFIEKLHSLHGDEFLPLSEYMGRKNAMRFFHKKCMKEVVTTPNNLLMGRGCNICANNQVLNTISFAKKLKEKTNSEYELVSEYVNSATHVKVKHLLCGNIYSVIPNNIIRGRRCPFCAQRGVTEREIFNELKKLYGNGVNRQVYFNDLTSNNGVYLRYDIELLLGSKKYMIEYNGEQHYTPMRYKNAQEKFKTTKKHDEMKKEYAIKKGYEFIVIRFDED